MAHVVFLLTLLTALNLYEVCAQSNGDLRLVGQSNGNLGRLEIYWKSRWSTFCGGQKGRFTQGAAQAACRQLGYLDVFQVDTVNKLNFSKATDDTPIAFGLANCEYEFDLGALHLLRCTTSETVPADCSHNDDIGLVCEPVSLWRHPYVTEVKLSNVTTPAYTSAGKVEIYVTNKWGSVCFSEEGFDQHAADSVCRQMGYTNAQSYKGVSAQSDEPTFFNQLTCGKESQQCIRCCPNFKLPTLTTSCKSNMYTYVQCTFDISQRDNSRYSAGSEAICSEECHESTSNTIVIAVVIIVLLLCIGSVLLILLCICCFMRSCGLYQWRKQKFSGYASM